MALPAAALAAVLVLAVSSTALAAALPPRIGDRGSVFDPSKFDPAWPIAREFAKAGVEGGIPPRSAVPVRARLKPGDDIQAAVDRAGPGGAVLLAPGLHRRTQPIRMKSGVVLRGSGRDSAIIEYDCTTGGQVGQAVLFKDCEGAGLEDLALRHAKVFAMDPAAYVGKYQNFPDLPTGNYAAIEILGKGTRNCWVQSCAILCSASRPLRIHGGPSHVTLRDNLTDRSLHKGGQGSGYYEVVGAAYVLLYNETIQNIRHICLDATCDYTVLVHCQVGVDINWHCIPPMRNTLVESVVSRVRPGHPWPPLCHYRDPSGPDNYIYKFDAESDKGNCDTSPDPSRVFTLRTNWDEKPWVYPVDRPAPRTGTLYPVTGVHRPPSAEAPRPSQPRGAPSM